MAENYYTSLDAVQTLIHALDYVCKEYVAMCMYGGPNTALAGELLSWYLAPQRFLSDHITQEFIL